MPLVRIDAFGDRPVPAEAFDALLRALPERAPVIVVIHGYSYVPGHPRRCPHDHIFSLAPRAAPRAMSWPRQLGFGRGEADEGLCIAFGWNASGSLRAAHAEAERAGRALARIVGAAGRLRPGPVHLVGHSLGARVALAAFGHLPEGSVGRALLLAGAETRGAAEAALGTPAGRTAEVVNVLSRENTIFDLLFRTAVHPHRPGARALGAGLGREDRRWLDLRIDCPGTRARLGAQGFRIPPPARAVCHWSAYLRPGLFPLYRALLRDGLPLAMLRETEGPPAAAAPPLSPLVTA
jgi:pimeloyl-ACP methyl ester carboxylesterase